MPGDINEYALSMELALSTGPALKAIANITKKLETVEQQIQRIGEKFVEIFQGKMATAIKIVPQIAAVSTPVTGMVDVDKDSLARFGEKIKVSVAAAIQEAVSAGFKKIPSTATTPKPPPAEPPVPEVPKIEPPPIVLPVTEMPKIDTGAASAAAVADASTLASRMAEEIAKAIGPAIASSIKGAGSSFDDLTADGRKMLDNLQDAIRMAEEAAGEAPAEAVKAYQEASNILASMKPMLKELNFPMGEWVKFNAQVTSGITNQVKHVRGFSKEFAVAYDEISALQKGYVEADVYTIKNALKRAEEMQRQLDIMKEMQKLGRLSSEDMKKAENIEKALGEFEKERWEKELVAEQEREKAQRAQRKHQAQFNALAEEGLGGFLFQRYIVDANLFGRAIEAIPDSVKKMGSSLNVNLGDAFGWFTKRLKDDGTKKLDEFAKGTEKSGKAIPTAMGKGLQAASNTPVGILSRLIGRFRKTVPTNPGTEPFIKSGESIAKALGKGIDNESDVPTELLKVLVGDMASTLIGQEAKVKDAAAQVGKDAVPKTEPAAGEGFKTMMTSMATGIRTFTAAITAIPWVAIAKLAIIGTIITGMLTAMVALAAWLASSGVMGVVSLIALSAAAIGFAFALNLVAAALPALAAGGTAAIPILLTLALVIGALALSVLAITAFVNAVTNLFKVFTENITAGFAFVGFMYALIPALVGLGVAIFAFSAMLLASMLPIAAAVAIGAALLVPAALFALTMTIIAGGVAVFAAAVNSLAAGLAAFTATAGGLGGALTQITTAVGTFGIAIVGFAMGLGAALLLLLPSILLMPAIVAGLVAFGAGLLGSMVLLSIAMFFGTAAVEWLTEFGLALKNISDAIVAMGSPGDRMREIAGGINELMGVKVDPFAVVGLYMLASGLMVLGEASATAANGIQALAGAGETITGVVDTVIAKEKDFDRAAGIVENFGDKMSNAFDKVSEKAVAGPFSTEATSKAETVTTVQITSDMARRTSEANRQTLDALTAIKEALEKITVKVGVDELRKIIGTLDTYLPQIAEGRGGGLVDDINRWKT